jgi:hypothetical protein
MISVKSTLLLGVKSASRETSRQASIERGAGIWRSMKRKLGASAKKRRRASEMAYIALAAQKA